MVLVHILAGKTGSIKHAVFKSGLQLKSWNAIFKPVLEFLLLAAHHLSKLVCAASHPHYQQWLLPAGSRRQTQLKGGYGEDSLVELMHSILYN